MKQEILYNCIYCNEAFPMLTDEHIIPFGLGGRIILENASCVSCNKITSKVENYILRGHWLGIRKKLQTGSRRRNQEPPRIRVKLTTHKGEVFEGTVLSEECNFQLLYDFYRPAIFDSSVEIQKIPIAKGIGMLFVDVVGPSALTTQSGKRIPIQPNGQIQYFTHQFTADNFFQFLAKVAHGYAIKEIGTGAFSELYLQGIILGVTENAMQYIGNASDETQGIRIKKVDQFHSLDIVEVDGYITVLIQFFNVLGHDVKPVYQVVVGKLR